MRRSSRGTGIPGGREYGDMARNDIMQRLADADPLDRSVAEEWERSGAAEAVLSRVLALTQEEAPPAPARHGRRRWAWAAPVTALAGIAVLVAVLLSGGQGAPTVSPALADRGRALASLAVSVETVGHPGVQVPPAPVDALRGLRQAAARETMRGSGAAAFVSANAVTWGEAVTWLWMAAGGGRPAVAPLGFASGSWRAPEAGMLAALTAAGFLSPGTARLHGPREPMTAAQWDALLLRLRG